MKLNKRGSHVGVVISFVVFIVFIIFLYSVIEPVIKVQKDKEFIIEYIKGELPNLVSENMTKISFRVNDGFEFENGKTCFKLDLDFPSISSPGSITKSNEEVINSKVSGDYLFVDESTPQGMFFEVFYSNEFDNSFEVTGCDEMQETEDFILGATSNKEYIFEKKIIQLINRHISNYEELKRELTVPEGSEFSLIFVKADKTEIKTEQKDIEANIYSQKVPIIYVDSEANIKSGYIIIKVW